jgi:hypothetical protein
MSSEQQHNELSDAVNRLVEITKQIAEARNDIKILTSAEKALKEQVKGQMMKNGIDTINLKKGKISVKKSVRKSTMTKKTVVAGLMSYFENDEKKVEDILSVIAEQLETKESTSLTMTGIKDKAQD